MVTIDDWNELKDAVGFWLMKVWHLHYLLLVLSEGWHNAEYLIVLLVWLIHNQRIHHSQPIIILVVTYIGQRRQKGSQTHQIMRVFELLGNLIAKRIKLTVKPFVLAQDVEYVV